ncbi:MAG: zf-HC2 domain-containing protein [Anaerolineae bacterium]|nr:zf-HC2 domain-containing protein [Anaerolineae bacterium]
MNDTAQHIDHLICAYVEGQLASSDVIAVRNHIARCDQCRETLARHERLSEDMRLAMKHFPPLRAGQIDSMWQNIRQQRQPIRRRTAITPKLIPMMASLILILAMMVTPLFSKSTAVAASNSAIYPEMNTPFIPTEMTEPITAEIMTTPQPERQTSVTPAIELSPQQPLIAVPPTALDYQ